MRSVIIITLDRRRRQGIDFQSDVAFASRDLTPRPPLPEGRGGAHGVIDDDTRDLFASRKERAHELLERAGADLIVRDAEHAQTSSLKDPGSLFVCGSLEIVHPSIDLEDEPMFDTHEIHDEATDDLLPPPLEPKQPPVAEQLPGPGL